MRTYVFSFVILVTVLISSAKLESTEDYEEVSHRVTDIMLIIAKRQQRKRCVCASMAKMASSLKVAILKNQLIDEGCQP